MVGPVGPVGPIKGSGAAGAGIPADSPGKITLPGSGTVRSVSIISDDAKASGGGLFSRMAGALGRALLSSTDSDDSPVAVGSSGSARAESTSPSTGLTRSMSGRATPTPLAVSDMPSSARTGSEYGKKLTTLFPEPGAKVAIQLSAAADVIGRPARPSLTEAVNRLTNMWREGSITALEGKTLPLVTAFEDEFKATHDGAAPKLKDYVAYINAWQETAFATAPLETRIEHMDIAYQTIKSEKQIVKDLERRASLMIGSSLGPAISTAATGAGTTERPAFGAGSPIAEVERWVGEALSGVTDKDVKLRILSSLQQGILVPVNKMADLLFNREFRMAGDGELMIEPTPRKAEDVRNLVANGVVTPNISEWVQDPDRGWGVAVDSKSGTVKAKLYFSLKGDPSFKFQGNITVDVRTGAASMEIVRMP